MAELKPCPYKKGDIVRNNYAGETNPNRYLMYIGKGQIRQGRYTSKSYDCLNYNGKKVQFFRDDNQLVVVGHMPEYDAFLAALKRLPKLQEWEG